MSFVRATRLSSQLSRPSTRLLLQRASITPFTLRAMATAIDRHQSLTEAVAEDHKEMYAYYDQYVKHAGNPEQQGPWARQLIWEVARHAISEEIVIYPLMEKHLGEEGVKLADGDRADHQQVKERLYKIESLTVGTPEHASLLQDIMAHLKPHNDSEEKHDLPLLEQAIGVQASKQAAKSFERTKKLVPTRSHPNAPNKPPFETLAGLLAAPMDKLKDAFATFPSEEEKEEVMRSQN